MNLETIRDIQSEYPGSSWAIWSESFPEDGCVEESTNQLSEFIYSNIDKLNNQVVFLSLNPSAEKPPGFDNFHSPSGRHYDDRLKEFIQDGGLENLQGGYMTDIVPDVVDPDSNNVTPDEADTKGFLGQLEALGNDEYDIICFSEQAFQALQEYSGSKERSLDHNIRWFSGNLDGISIRGYRVWHYSNYGSNADKVPELKRQLQYLNDEIQY